MVSEESASPTFEVVILSISALAGAAGFEPANNGTKNRCLTAWPRPIMCAEPQYFSSLQRAEQTHLVAILG